MTQDPHTLQTHTYLNHFSLTSSLPNKDIEGIFTPNEFIQDLINQKSDEKSGKKDREGNSLEQSCAKLREASESQINKQKDTNVQIISISNHVARTIDYYEPNQVTQNMDDHNSFDDSLTKRNHEDGGSSGDEQYRRSTLLNMDRQLTQSQTNVVIQNPAALRKDHNETTVTDKINPEIELIERETAQEGSAFINITTNETGQIMDAGNNNSDDDSGIREMYPKKNMVSQEHAHAQGESQYAQQQEQHQIISFKLTVNSNNQGSYENQANNPGVKMNGSNQSQDQILFPTSVTNSQSKQTFPQQFQYSDLIHSTEKVLRTQSTSNLIDGIKQVLIDSKQKERHHGKSGINTGMGNYQERGLINNSSGKYPKFTSLVYKGGFRPSLSNNPRQVYGRKDPLSNIGNYRINYRLKDPKNLKVNNSALSGASISQQNASNTGSASKIISRNETVTKNKENHTTVANENPLHLPHQNMTTTARLSGSHYGGRTLEGFSKGQQDQSQSKFQSLQATSVPNFISNSLDKLTKEGGEGFRGIGGPGSNPIDQQQLIQMAQAVNDPLFSEMQHRGGEILLKREEDITSLKQNSRLQRLESEDVRRRQKQGFSKIVESKQLVMDLTDDSGYNNKSASLTPIKKVSSNQSNNSQVEGHQFNKYKLIPRKDHSVPRNVAYGMTQKYSLVSSAQPLNSPKGNFWNENMSGTPNDSAHLTHQQMSLSKNSSQKSKVTINLKKGRMIQNQTNLQKLKAYQILVNMSQSSFTKDDKGNDKMPQQNEQLRKNQIMGALGHEASTKLRDFNPYDDAKHTGNQFQINLPENSKNGELQNFKGVKAGIQPLPMQIAQIKKVQMPSSILLAQVNVETQNDMDKHTQRTVQTKESINKLNLKSFNHATVTEDAGLQSATLLKSPKPITQQPSARHFNTLMDTNSVSSDVLMEGRSILMATQEASIQNQDFKKSNSIKPVSTTNNKSKTLSPQQQQEPGTQFIRGAIDTEQQSMGKRDSTLTLIQGAIQENYNINITYPSAANQIASIKPITSPKISQDFEQNTKTRNDLNQPRLKIPGMRINQLLFKDKQMVLATKNNIQEQPQIDEATKSNAKQDDSSDIIYKNLYEHEQPLYLQIQLLRQADPYQNQLIEQFLKTERQDTLDLQAKQAALNHHLFMQQEQANIERYKRLVAIPDAISRSFVGERNQLPQRQFDFKNKLKPLKDIGKSVQFPSFQSQKYIKRSTLFRQKQDGSDDNYASKPDNKRRQLSNSVTSLTKLQSKQLVQLQDKYEAASNKNFYCSPSKQHNSQILLSVAQKQLNDKDRNDKDASGTTTEQQTLSPNINSSHRRKRIAESKDNSQVDISDYKALLDKGDDIDKNSEMLTQGKSQVTLPKLEKLQSQMNNSFDWDRIHNLTKSKLLHQNLSNYASSKDISPEHGWQQHRVRGSHSRKTLKANIFDRSSPVLKKEITTGQESSLPQIHKIPSLKHNLLAQKGKAHNDTRNLNPLPVNLLSNYNQNTSSKLSVSKPDGAISLNNDDLHTFQHSQLKQYTTASANQGGHQFYSRGLPSTKSLMSHSINGVLSHSQGVTSANYESKNKQQILQQKKSKEYQQQLFIKLKQQRSNQSNSKNSLTVTNSVQNKSQSRKNLIDSTLFGQLITHNETDSTYQKGLPNGQRLQKLQPPLNTSSMVSGAPVQYGHRLVSLKYLQSAYQNQSEQFINETPMMPDLKKHQDYPQSLYDTSLHDKLAKLHLESQKHLAQNSVKVPQIPPKVFKCPQLPQPSGGTPPDILITSGSDDVYDETRGNLSLGRNIVNLSGLASTEVNPNRSHLGALLIQDTTTTALNSNSFSSPEMMLLKAMNDTGTKNQHLNTANALLGTKPLLAGDATTGTPKKIVLQQQKLPEQHQQIFVIDETSSEAIKQTLLMQTNSSDPTKSGQVNDNNDSAINMILLTDSELRKQRVFAQDLSSSQRMKTKNNKSYNNTEKLKKSIIPVMMSQVVSSEQPSGLGDRNKDEEEQATSLQNHSLNNSFDGSALYSKNNNQNDSSVIDFNQRIELKKCQNLQKQLQQSDLKPPNVNFMDQPDDLQTNVEKAQESKKDEFKKQFDHARQYLKQQVGLDHKLKPLKNNLKYLKQQKRSNKDEKDRNTINLHNLRQKSSRQLIDKSAQNLNSQSDYNNSGHASQVISLKNSIIFKENSNKSTLDANLNKNKPISPKIRFKQVQK